MRLLPSLALGGSLALGLCLASAARAVIIDSGDGTGNTGAPADDPGWSHVGRRGGLTAIYMGNGWVLTANHVGEGDVVLEGVTYPAVTGSKIRIGGADLAVFQIDPSPGLPILPISAATNLVGAEVTMIGNARHNRGRYRSCQRSHADVSQHRSYGRSPRRLDLGGPAPRGRAFWQPEKSAVFWIGRSHSDGVRLAAARPVDRGFN